MTASERLRALDRAVKDPQFPFTQESYLWTLGDALPLIADCIEAAERDMDYLAEKWRGESFVIPETTNALGLALTALREALDSGTPDRGEVVGPRGQDSAISAEPPPEHLEGGRR